MTEMFASSNPQPTGMWSSDAVKQVHQVGNRTIMPSNRSLVFQTSADRKDHACLTLHRPKPAFVAIEASRGKERAVTLAVGVFHSNFGLREGVAPLLGLLPKKSRPSQSFEAHISHKAFYQTNGDIRIDVALQGLTFSFDFSFSPHHSAPPHAYPSHPPTLHGCLIPINAAILGPEYGISA